MAERRISCPDCANPELGSFLDIHGVPKCDPNAMQIRTAHKDESASRRARQVTDTETEPMSYGVQLTTVDTSRMLLAKPSWVLAWVSGVGSQRGCSSRLAQHLSVVVGVL